MANYQDTVDYFRNLAVSHEKIRHSLTDEKQKKFFRLNIEEFVSGSVQNLPNEEQRCFFVFINYLTKFSFEKSQNKNRQLMFYIMSKVPKGDFNKDEAVRSLTETVVLDFLLKMKADSNNNHPLFQHSFDTMDDVKVIPAELKSVSGDYIGWQVVILLPYKFNVCPNNSVWL